MIYEIFHETKFNYPSLVTFSHDIARLTPKNCSKQKLLEHTLEISPTPFETSEFTDYFGNENTFMLIREAHKDLIVTSKSKVELLENYIYEEINKAKALTITYQEAKQRLRKDPSDVLACHYLFETDSIPMASKNIKEYVLQSFSENRPIFEATYEFMQRIFNDFKFVSGFTDITTPIELVFEQKKGCVKILPNLQYLL